MRPDTFVYFIATVDRSMVKIGCSHRPEKRLSNLMAWSPVPLEIIATAEGTGEDERAIHASLSQYHSHREWFRGSAEVMAVAAEIARTGAIPDRLRGRPGQRNVLWFKRHNAKRTPEQRERMRKITIERWDNIRASRTLWAQVDRFLCENRMLLADFEVASGLGKSSNWRNDHPYFEHFWGERVRAFMAGYPANREGAAA